MTRHRPHPSPCPLAADRARRGRARGGTVLVVVAGLCALLAALATAFLMRMRSDVHETAIVVQRFQAQIMLLAACDYVLEAGRLGYDATPSATSVHTEAFGWADVRDGSIGPSDQNHHPLWSAQLVDSSGASPGPDRPAWPAIGSVARCPMYALTRPPYAIRLTTVYNPIVTDPANGDFGIPYLLNPDPPPVVANGWPQAVSAASFAQFAAGDRRPLGGTQGMAWFRVCRIGIASFVVTCGAGGTDGFKDWSEVTAQQAQDEFGGDSGLFAQLQAAEVRRWYRIEWSGAVGASDYHFLDNELYPSDHWVDNFYLHPMNVSQMSLGRSQRSQMRCTNDVGTIRMVEWLAEPPAQW